MLQIKSRQMAMWNERAQNDWVERLLAHIGRAWPSLIETVSGTTLRSKIAGWLQAAEAFPCGTEREIVNFVDLHLFMEYTPDGLAYSDLINGALTNERYSPEVRIEEAWAMLERVLRGNPVSTSPEEKIELS